jgi:hypothetical protein
VHGRLLGFTAALADSDIGFTAAVACGELIEWGRAEDIHAHVGVVLVEGPQYYWGAFAIAISLHGFILDLGGGLDGVDSEDCAVDFDIVGFEGEVLAGVAMVGGVTLAEWEEAHSHLPAAPLAAVAQFWRAFFLAVQASQMMRMSQ